MRIQDSPHQPFSNEPPIFLSWFIYHKLGLFLEMPYKSNHKVVSYFVAFMPQLHQRAYLVRLIITVALGT